MEFSARNLLFTVVIYCDEAGQLLFAVLFMFSFQKVSNS